MDDKKSRDAQRRRDEAEDRRHRREEAAALRAELQDKDDYPDENMPWG